MSKERFTKRTQDWSLAAVFGTISLMFSQVKKATIASLVSVCLVASTALPVGLSASSAYADDLSDAQAALSSAQSQLDALTAEYDELVKQAETLDQEIADTTQRVVDAQSKMVAGQEDLGETVSTAYKTGEQNSLINIFLSSETFEDFSRNLSYYTKIQEDQAEQVETQRQLRDEFNSALDELNKQQDEQDEILKQAQNKVSEAEKVVSDASSKVSALEAEQLAAQAAAMAQQEQEEQSQAAVSPSWNTKPGGGSSGGNDNSTPAPQGWKTGSASAYGGSSDKSTPNPGVTASGAICNDSSMGVAIPMAWKNYRSYFGHAIEINYNGKTVVATINDCGGLAGGARSLDLQPGVFKAFGFSTCQAWGVRTVSYRIL